VLTVVLLVWLWFRLWQWILLLIILASLAVGLDPVVRRAYGTFLIVLLIAVGSAATSALAAVVTYIFLVIAGVPAPLLLALLTGLFDFVPVIGVFLTAIPMVLLTLTVSTWVAIATAASTRSTTRSRPTRSRRRSTGTSCGCRVWR
jgi:hypothetical protein